MATPKPHADPGLGHIELVERAKALAATRVDDGMDAATRMDVLESAMMELLDVQIMKPFVGRVTSLAAGGAPAGNGPWLMGEDPRLPPMPQAPTLIDFFERRILLDRRGGNHLLQSAKLAMEKDLPEPLVLACLLHDISVICLIRSDHGYWGAQLVAPYVDEEVAWAIRHHQVLRFFPAPELGYEYPASYLRFFGEDYVPPPHIRRDYEHARRHRWYMSSMQICLNDLYAFDPDKKVDLHEFEDVIGRHFKQPKEGLGFDGSPVAHMWRTIIAPNNFL
ncbi:MAG: hypothetical protein R3286_01350 [Gammaproteobacteria bacterium]|nr:hypothetical protein [Gammaproteobacteria bacterium]